jgi:hypothetical protein
MLARLLLVVIFAVALAAAAEAPPDAGMARKARCQLILTSAPARADTGAAAVLELSCRGAPLVAAANRTLLGLEPTATFPGVKWDARKCGPLAARCLLTVCGDTVAVFEGPVIQGLVMPSPPQPAGGADATPPSSLPVICVAGSAKVTLLGAVIAGNTNASALVVLEQGSLAIGRGSVITGNRAPAPPVSVSANGTLVVRNTTRFVNNTAGSPEEAGRGMYEANCGGALGISGSAKVEIQGGVAIVGNTAGHGGGICVRGAAWACLLGGALGLAASIGAAEQACFVAVMSEARRSSLCSKLLITTAPRTGSASVVVGDGTLLANNTAGGSGGAIVVAGASKLEVSNASISNNDANAGGGVLALGLASCQLSGTSIIGNRAAEAGGGISVRGAAQANLTDCQLADNTAAFSNGGGLEVSGSAGAVLLQTHFVANEAANGPDLWVGPGAEVQVLAGTNVGPSNATVTWAREGRCAVGEALPGGGCSRCGGWGAVLWRGVGWVGALCISPLLCIQLLAYAQVKPSLCRDPRRRPVLHPLGRRRCAPSPP